ncbi:MAG: hypothetical protein CBB68_14310 [Rhodospirillaceae bacterium TMED8]|nr:hypothetical protein [Magnetovibrio sp.]OUT48129.1 MAG: hypothetical protein CBB68_14310 [Rhodospirillaceae bacterium TMED8]|tara:strand:- start:676 stop:975 length:300 start_codon:yes stop_codon:yes gene_type:complete
MTRSKSLSKRQTRSLQKRGVQSSESLMRLLLDRMSACPDAERLNDNVIMPFVTALETVCARRGYVMNIFGETSNIVYTGDANDAESIYSLIEHYLDNRE